jgi:hypothetical protein
MPLPVAEIFQAIHVLELVEGETLDDKIVRAGSVIRRARWALFRHTA